MGLEPTTYNLQIRSLTCYPIEPVGLAILVPLVKHLLAKLAFLASVIPVIGRWDTVPVESLVALQ